MRSTQFKDRGIGIVAADKNDDSKFIDVFLLEHLAFHEGDISNDFVNIVKTGKDSDDNTYSHTLQRGPAIKVEWIGASNRVTSPNVRKGEEVRVYEKESTDEYYWAETSRNPELRRTEKITYAVNADRTPVTVDVPPINENHYVFDIDGKDGRITISTSLANNEQAGYIIQINGNDGHLTITDKNDSPNTIQINSLTDSIILKNGHGTYINLNGGQIDMYAPERVNIKSPFVWMSKVLDVEEHVETPVVLTDVMGPYPG